MSPLTAAAWISEDLEFRVGDSIVRREPSCNPVAVRPVRPGASNTFSRVIHDRVKRAVRNSHSEVVNNSAAAQTGPSENLAAAGTQTGASNPERVKPRTLASPAARRPNAART